MLLSRKEDLLIFHFLLLKTVLRPVDQSVYCHFSFEDQPHPALDLCREGLIGARPHKEQQASETRMKQRLRYHKGGFLVNLVQF